MAGKHGAVNVSAQLTKQADKAAHFLRVLSNRHRLRVLCLLLDGELSVGEINASIKVSQAVLSQHLAVLRDNHLVHTRRAAQTIYYSVAPGPVGGVIIALHDAFCRQDKDRPTDREHAPAVARPRKSPRVVRASAGS